MKNNVKVLSNKPGCYRMLEKGQVLYVKRVASYAKMEGTLRIKRMISKFFP